jgi:glutaredoxin
MPNPDIPTITLFTRPNCHLCDSARHVIEQAAQRTRFNLEIINIDAEGQQHWLDQYDHHVPVIHIHGREIARHKLDPGTLRQHLHA